jgi:1-aminocyclopropane-1-carboxylate deaminase/D-cysteine desulfhydrase-like pyridoxal-dependent ACC family enzyme
VIGTDLAARVRLAALPTPLVRAPRLAEALGIGALHVKRDDLTGFAFAGNKARPLEFLLAAALAEGADTLVTGGTLAGLVAGNVLAGRPLRLAGASVSRPPEETAGRVLRLARECLALLSPGEDVAPDDVVVADARGPGHGLASTDGTAAAEQAMRTEGLMVDPVYTAKALALVSRYADGGNVVFWHTGGQLDAVALAAEAGR